MLAVDPVGLVAALGEAEQVVPVEGRSAADSPVGASTVALAVSLVAIAAAEAGAAVVPGFAGVSTGDAVLGQLGFARLGFASWKQASFAQADRVVLAGRAGLGCSAASSHVALPGDVAAPVAVHVPVAGLAAAAVAAVAVAGLELAAAAVVGVA